MDPKIRLGHIISEQPKQTVFCVGAGISARYGVPTWERLNKEIGDKLNQYYVKHRKPEDVATLESEKNQFKDQWSLGGYLKDKTPANLYIDWVREVLSRRSKSSETYKNIWNLNPKGLISFNLDSICIDESQGKIESHNISYGLLDESSSQFYMRTKQWIYLPHGGLKKPESWVLARTARDKIQEKKAYKNFMTTIFNGYNVIFAGINPKEFSLETILTQTLDQKSGLGKHFWLCADPTAEDRQYASEYNISIIPFSSTNDYAQLDDYLIEFSNVKPRERNAEFAYQGDTINPDDLPPDGELYRKGNLEEIRSFLNAGAKGAILAAPKDGNNQENEYRAYTSFLKKYPISTRLALTLDTATEHDTIFGFRADGEPKGGAFGRIFRATDMVSGDLCAIKIMREDILSNPELLQAFRRGVQASKILTSKNVDGMVKFLNAYEIPPCIFMEYINGPTLEEFVLNGHMHNAILLSDTFNRITSIIKSAHELEETVLHRDLKPANVMIRDFYVDNMEFSKDNIVLLDFDLSWYKGAVGMSIIPGGGAHGYAAPEQYYTGKRAHSSQRTDVDVFSIGMLLYFCVTKKHPTPNIQERANFAEEIEKDFTGILGARLSCIPKLISSIIQDCTYTDATKRISTNVILERMKEIRYAESTGLVNTNSKLFFYEFLLCFLKDDWLLSSVNETQAIVTKMAKKIKVETIESGGYTATLTFNAQGFQDTKHEVEYNKANAERVNSVLKRLTDHAIEKNVERLSFSVSASSNAIQLTIENCHKISKTVLESANAIHQ